MSDYILRIDLRLSARDDLAARATAQEIHRMLDAPLAQAAGRFDAEATTKLQRVVVSGRPRGIKL